MSVNALFDLPAPAKLNLFLHIVGRRRDGYHLLQSAFVLVDWTDTLHVELRRDGALRRHDLGAALPADDLCLRAARALQSASGTTLGADISIDKRVPSGAGMGGGSSDAATTLLALNRLWCLRWPRERLAQLALPLGADVPFFVHGTPAWVEGIGERITPMPLAPARYAVVKPPAHIATADIFTHPGLKRDTVAVIVIGSLEEAGSGGNAASRQQMESLGADVQGGWGRNDLQPVAEERCAEVARAARWLEARYGNSRMTGSGSAVFARAGASDPPSATVSEQGLAGLPEGWVGRMCRSLVEHPLRGWAG